MAEHGFVPFFPLFCRREGGKIIVVDGQARLALAEEMELPVYYVIAKGKHAFVNNGDMDLTRRRR